jgi:hypothetical protein
VSDATGKTFKLTKSLIALRLPRAGEKRSIAVVPVGSLIAITGLGEKSRSFEAKWNGENLIVFADEFAEAVVEITWLNSMRMAG